MGVLQTAGNALVLRNRERDIEFLLELDNYFLKL
jgi:hypothetical protein